MPTNQGIIVLMGSGELTGTMVEVHKELLGRYGNVAQAVFLDTPAGFQLNVDQISQKALDYFKARVQRPLTVASFKSADTAGTDLAAEQAFQALGRADYILIGPGSPTYALQQWQKSPIPRLLKQCVAAGGCLVTASAAALTVGRFTLPVYEIYKVGQTPHWVEGMNILADFGFNLVVVPHWNNAEGGHHDTRFCFMGAPRMRQLETLLPAPVDILGLDEHTALVIDLARGRATIKGIGRVTLRRQGQETVFTKDDDISLALLRGQAAATKIQPAPTPEENVPPSGHGQDDALWDQLHALGEQVQIALDAHHVEPAVRSLLALEHYIWQVHQELQARDGVGAARELLREKLALLGIDLASRPANRQVCLAPLVDAMLALREQFRVQKKWSEADALRECLEQAEIGVEDTPQGARWHLKQETQ